MIVGRIEHEKSVTMEVAERKYAKLMMMWLSAQCPSALSQAVSIGWHILSSSMNVIRPLRILRPMMKYVQVKRAFLVVILAMVRQMLHLTKMRART